MDADLTLSDSLKNGGYFSDPYPLFDELRRENPVFYANALGGWVILAYEDVDAVLKDATTFSSKGRISHLINQLDPEVVEQLNLLGSHFSTGLAHSDAPEHRRLRGLLAQAFTPRMIENARSLVRTEVEKRVAALPHDFDLIEDLFTPIPALIVGKMLGSSEGDIPDLIRWAGAINGLYEKGGRIDPDKALYAESMLLEIREFVLELVDNRRANPLLNPTADVLSALVYAEREGKEGDSLSESEMVSTVVTLFVAGHETTTHLLGNGFYALLQKQNLFEDVKSDYELINSTIEEMARFDGSVPRSWRITKADCEVAGVKIPKGDLVLPILASANRDPKVFDNPHSFDIRRDSRKHLAFGKGVHVCLGAPLARVEGQEILKVLLKERPNLRLDDSKGVLKWRQDVALRGLISMPVKT